LETDYRRLFLAIGLSVAVVIGWGLLFGSKGPQEQPGKPTATQPEAGQTGGTASAAPAEEPSGSPSPAPAPVAAPMPAPGAPEEVWTLETKEFAATLSSWGGGLKDLRLKGKKFGGINKETGVWEPINLVHGTEGEAYPLSIAVLAGQDVKSPAGNATLRTPMMIVSKDDRSVTFQGEVGPFVVTKKYRTTDRPYEIELSIEARAEEAGAAGKSLAIVYTGYLSPDAPKPGFLSGGEATEIATPICRAGGKTIRKKDDEAFTHPDGTASWIGIEQRYFVSILMAPGTTGDCILAQGSVPGSRLAALRLPAGEKVSWSFKVFAGPKMLEILRSYNQDLDSAIDYGVVTNLFSIFARGLLWVMRWFERVVRNWGVAIMLLTLLVKLVLYPLTHKSMASMMKMKTLQPEMEKLKAKYGDDKEKLNLAVMQMYKEKGVNPLGGCLPMLLQMPIWLALYSTLQTSVELYHEPFLWMADLTAKDPFYILPIAMGISSFIMQKMSPQTMDNAQAKMMLYAMPIFFTFIMLKLPAGLTLYILVNNLLSIVQQQILMRQQKPAAPATT
jgi:YidC/Oxa1 family membrane protein insertase